MRAASVKGKLGVAQKTEKGRYDFDNFSVR
jgi:hypothetical protein